MTRATPHVSRSEVASFTAFRRAVAPSLRAWSLADPCTDAPGLSVIEAPTTLLVSRTMVASSKVSRPDDTLRRIENPSHRAAGGSSMKGEFE
jgi:hypothetical protein